MRAGHLAALVAAIALLKAPARADEFPNPLIKVEITGLSPAVDGIEAHIFPSKLAHLAPQIELSNTTTSELLLLGTTGEPFMRVGPTGVFGNLRSQTWMRSYDPTGRTGPAPSGGGRPGPLWRQYSRAPKWHWYEPRAQYRGTVPSPIATGRSVARLADWTIPGRYRDAAFSIDGRVVYRPVLGSITARITGVDPQPAGVRFRLVQSSLPGIEIQNDSSDVVEITGRDGAPFLRVGPSGVEANVNSATFRDTRPSAGSNGAEPKWTLLQQTPVFLWVERRAAYAQPEAPDAIQQAGRRAKLFSWSVPGTVAGRPLRIDGVTEWVPVARESKAAPRSSSWPQIAILAIALVALTAGAAAFVRRRNR